MTSQREHSIIRFQNITFLLFPVEKGSKSHYENEEPRSDFGG